jgi:hypothetical protein
MRIIATAILLLFTLSALRQPIDKYWLGYLNGEGTLEEAIDKIVGEIQH